MIAYAGDEHSVRAVRKLIELMRSDSDLFGAHIGKRREVGESVRGGISSTRIGRRHRSQIHNSVGAIGIDNESDAACLGGSDARKYGKVPGETEWATDPIAFRLKDQASQELRQSVLRFAAEAKSNEKKGEAWKNLNTTVKNPMKNVSHRHPTKSPMLGQTSCEASNC